MNRFEKPSDRVAYPTERFGSFEVEEFTLRDASGADIGTLFGVRFDYSWDETNLEFRPTFIEYHTDPDLTVRYRKELHPHDTSGNIPAILLGWRLGGWPDFIAARHEFNIII